MACRVDTKELEALLARLGDAEKREEFCEKATKELASGLLRMVTSATPVDTGYLRNNWTGKSEVIKANGTYKSELINNTEYASYVENGHRIMRNGVQVGYVPPRYYVKKSEEKFDSVSHGLLEKKLNRFIKETLDGK